MSPRERVVVVTGLSGAGKSTALRALADLGYYCVDNLPPVLVRETIGVCQGSGLNRIALGIDVRVGAFLDTVADVITTLQTDTADLVVLFLEASDEALVKRFSETRRPHPIFAQAAPDELLAGGAAVSDGVKLERQRLASLKRLATVVVDTTHDSVHELRRQVLATFSEDGQVRPRMLARVMSFGFKFGVPLDADLLFDARFLDNPYFVPGLREKTGCDAEVRQFVDASPGCAEFVDRIAELLEFAFPRYEQEGKSYLTVGVGCTGGRHRSVVVSNALAKRLSVAVDREIGIVHRDVSRQGAIELASGSGDKVGGAV